MGVCVNLTATLYLADETLMVEWLYQISGPMPRSDAAVLVWFLVPGSWFSLASLSVRIRVICGRSLASDYSANGASLTFAK